MVVRKQPRWWVNESEPEFNEPERLSIPSWLPGAWEALDDAELIERSLGIFYEGMQIRDSHPSLALVAFVGTIENFGERFHQLKTCDKCGMSKGATKRFKKAVNHVAPDWVAQKVLDLYDPRSKTVHVGMLHGLESVLGVPFGEGIAGIGSSRNSPTSFHTASVTWIKNIARDLLISALEGDPSLRG